MSQIQLFCPASDMDTQDKFSETNIHHSFTRQVSTAVARCTCIKIAVAKEIDLRLID
jgi:hypothetical protein